MPVCNLCKQNVNELLSGRLRCRSCQNAWLKAYRENQGKKLYDSTKEKAKAARRTPEGKVKTLLVNGKCRAKARGLAFDVTLDDLTIPTHCPYLGIVLDYGVDGVVQRNSPTLDRIDCNLGYIKGNVEIISYRANTMKNDAPVDELLAFADAIKAKFT